MNPGDRIGDWVVVDRLGEGGMGAVYLCHNALSQRMRAAVKVLKAHELGDGRERFIREMEALATLTHESIVRVMGSGEDPVTGCLYMAMELLEGQTLEQRIARGVVPWREAVTTFTGITRALRHAHEQGIRHRDIKPANIILCNDGAVKVLDFGIAVHAGRTRLTNDRTVPGTLPYIAPEVFESARPDPVLADVYASGVVLYEMLSGYRAFPEDPDLSAGQRLAKLMMAKLTGGPLDPKGDVPEGVRQIVQWATKPLPQQRLPDMTAFCAALEAVGGGGEDALPSVPDRDGTPHLPPPLVEVTPIPSAGHAPPTVWDALSGGQSNETIDTGDLLDTPFGRDEPSVVLADYTPGPDPLPWIIGGLAVVLVGGGFGLWWTMQDPTTGGALVDPVTGPGASGEAELPREGEPGWALAAVGYDMVRVEAVEGWVGSTERDDLRDEDEARHPVQITRPFLIGATEVTQELWSLVMDDNPSMNTTQLWDGEEKDPCRDWGVGPNLPVTCVSWYAAVIFCDVLSAVEGLQPPYLIEADEVTWDPQANGYRLPTEAEWELAAAAGSASRFVGTDAPSAACATGNVANRSTKDKHYAWLTWAVFDCEDGHRELAPAAALPPNAWGLFDMSGNVREWTWDRYGPYDLGTSRDPRGPAAGALRVDRGGSWSDPPENARLTDRRATDPLTRAVGLGLRLVRNAE